MGYSIENDSTEQPVAVVTGSTRGFGEQIARNLTDRGWLTVGLARHEDELINMVKKVGGEYEVCDLSDDESVQVAAGNILGRHPSIKLLVNNAGKALRETFGAADNEAVVSVMDTNYHGTYYLTKLLLPGLIEAKPADIINIVSAAGTITKPSSGPYGAAKAAETTWSRCLTVDLRPFGIDVHTLHPGEADTPGHPQSNKSLVSRLTGTDVETVARKAVNQIGNSSNEIYVPRILKFVALAQILMPVHLTRIINKAAN